MYWLTLKSQPGPRGFVVLKCLTFFNFTSKSPEKSKRHKS